MVIIKRGSPNYSPENEKRNRRSTGAASSFAEKGYAIILKNELKKKNFDLLHAVILGMTKRGTKSNEVGQGSKKNRRVTFKPDRGF